MTERDPSWDPEVEDAELRGLEDALAPLRHRAPLKLPLPARKRPPARWPIYAGAVALAAAIALVVWRPWKSSPGAHDPALIACAEDLGGFRYEAIAGTASCQGEDSAAGWLPVGGALETGDGEQIRLEVADIGEIQLAEHSRLGLVATGPTQHRLALDRGRLHAKVTAPPRLFVIDTPTATAIDLGCEYDLEVAVDGGATLRVTKGFVELADGDRVSVVPMGASATTRPGVGPGTPWANDASADLRAAIERFDRGDATALDDLLRLAGERDTVTLFNLIGRVAGDERGRLYDAIEATFSIPEWVLRDDVVAGDAGSIANLRDALEGEWMLASEPDEPDEPDGGVWGPGAWP